VETGKRDKKPERHRGVVVGEIRGRGVGKMSPRKNSGKHQKGHGGGGGGGNAAK